MIWSPRDVLVSSLHPQAPLRPREEQGNCNEHVASRGPEVLDDEVLGELVGDADLGVAGQYKLVAILAEIRNPLVRQVFSSSP